MGGLVTQHRIVPEDENITRTISPFPPDVTPGERGGADAPGKSPPGRSSRPCAYVVAASWRFGGPDPFCNAPAAPGSAYCPRHRALCEPARPGAIDPVSPPDEAPPPPEFAYLAAAPLAESLECDEPAEDLAAFPASRRDAAFEE